MITPQSTRAKYYEDNKEICNKKGVKYQLHARVKPDRERLFSTENLLKIVDATVSDAKPTYIGLEVDYKSNVVAKEQSNLQYGQSWFGSVEAKILRKCGCCWRKPSL